MSIFVSVLFFGAATAWAQPGFAEDPRGVAEKAPEAKVIRTIPLSHVSSQAMRGAIWELGLPVSVTATGQNTVIVHGGESDVERVKQLVAMLDAAPTAAGAMMTTEFLRLRHRPPGDVMAVLEGLLARSSAQFGLGGPAQRLAFDERNRTLVLRALPDEISAVKEVLGELDRPGRTYTLQFFFVRAGIGARDSSGEPAIPKDLQPVLDPLVQSGFSNPSLLAPLVVFADDGERFESQSELNSSGSESREERVRIQVEGRILSLGTGDSVQLDLSAALHGSYSLRKENDGRTLFELKTTVVAREGHYTVLAAVPVSTLSGNAVALVVRATRN
jgi:hypothetical protein